MCGIYGWCLRPGVSTPETLPLANAILAQAMCERGEHSWGVMLPDRTMRGLGSLLDTRIVRKIPDNRMVSTHTRFATHGAQTIDNAHPFRCGSIVGMHNGVLSNHYELNGTYNRGFQVDSQHIFQHLADGRDMDDLKGYGTIVYHRDDTPGAFFIGKFNGGDLAVARISHKGRPIGVLWASTAAAVQDACAIARLKHTWVDVVSKHVCRIEDGEIFNTDVVLNVADSWGKAKTRAAVSSSSQTKSNGIVVVSGSASTTASTTTGTRGSCDTRSGYDEYSGDADDWYGNGYRYEPAKPAKPKSKTLIGASAETTWVKHHGRYVRLSELPEDEQEDALEAEMAAEEEAELQRLEAEDEAEGDLFEMRLKMADAGYGLASDPCETCGEAADVDCVCRDCYCAPCTARGVWIRRFSKDGDGDGVLARLEAADREAEVATSGEAAAAEAAAAADAGEQACLTCDGRGRVARQTCADCNGTGLADEEADNDGSQVCPLCDGVGYAADGETDCVYCGGSGEVSSADGGLYTPTQLALPSGTESDLRCPLAACNLAFGHLGECTNEKELQTSGKV